MNTAISFPTPRRELDRRFTGGLEVALYWNGDDDSVSVEVWHAATGETFSIAVAREDALEAFHHPFAYMDPVGAAAA